MKLGFFNETVKIHVWSHDENAHTNETIYTWQNTIMYRALWSFSNFFAYITEIFLLISKKTDILVIKVKGIGGKTLFHNLMLFYIIFIKVQDAFYGL